MHVFQYLVPFINVDVYVNLIERLCTDELVGFIRFFVVSVRKHSKHVPTSVGRSLSEALAAWVAASGSSESDATKTSRLVDEVFNVIVARCKDAQIACLLCLQHYFR
jgi:hypothetical protein